TWSASDEFAVQLTVMDRPPLHPEIGELVGDFTTVNLFEVREGRSGAFRDRAERLQRRMLEDLRPLDFSAIDVLRALGRQPGRASGGHAVFTSVLKRDELDDDFALLRRHGLEAIESLSQTPQVLLDCQVFEEEGALRVAWDAPDALYPEG